MWRCRASCCGATLSVRRRSGTGLPTSPLLRCPHRVGVNNDDGKAWAQARAREGHPDALRDLSQVRTAAAGTDRVQPLSRGAGPGLRRCPMSGGRWVDPAPFEGARPRVPWWVLVPGRLRWIAFLLALVWLALVGV